jgi:hypothetical protein
MSEPAEVSGCHSLGSLGRFPISSRLYMGHLRRHRTAAHRTRPSRQCLFRVHCALAGLVIRPMDRRWQLPHLVVRRSFLLRLEPRRSHLQLGPDLLQQAYCPCRIEPLLNGMRYQRECLLTRNPQTDRKFTNNQSSLPRWEEPGSRLSWLHPYFHRIMLRPV